MNFFIITCKHFVHVNEVHHEVKKDEFLMDVQPFLDERENEILWLILL